MDWLTLLLLILLAPFLWQWLRDLNARILRSRLIREMEGARKSKVIALVHKEEKNRLFGLARSNMIDLEDAGAVLDALREAPAGKPVDLILHTPGGYVMAAEQIAQALTRRKGPVTAFVPYHALSGGTLIALAADEIVMDERAVLGRIDPQLFYIPAQSIKKALDRKGEEKASEPGLVLADLAQKALRQLRDFLWSMLLAKGYADPVAEVIAGELISDKLLHDAPVFCDEAAKWGLRVKTGMPEPVYGIVENSGPRV